MKKPEKYNRQTLEKLLFRRQFFLGGKFINVFASSGKIKINESMFLTVHSDLEITQAVKGEKSITLLGYILDPNNPKSKNSDIVEELIYKLDPCDHFFEYISEYGGRWILIVNDGKQFRLYHDAAGLRQVFYTDPSYFTNVCCASQPGLIAEVLNLEIDKEALEFMNSFEYKNNKQHWWPGDTSPYKGIKLLLPNHYLDLHSGQSHRYWPDKNLDKIAMREAVLKSSKILLGLMESAQHRFELALSLTAGWDSRVMLAASKGMTHDIYYFTSIYWHKDKDSPDLMIPLKLLSKLGLQHNIIEYPGYVNEEFKKIYKRNVVTAHDVYGAIALGLYDYYPPNRVCIKGDVAEITKCYYRLAETNGQEITAHELSKLTKLGNNSFVMNAFVRWLSDVKNSYNIHLLDLFCWEQMVGCWISMIQSECDIAQEAFTPFNCRSLITTMLSVKENDRRPPMYRLHKSMIKNLWKEVLCEPINPQPRSIRNLIREILIKINLYQFVPPEIKKLGKMLLNK